MELRDVLEFIAVVLIFIAVSLKRNKDSEIDFLSRYWFFQMVMIIIAIKLLTYK